MQSYIVAITTIVIRYAYIHMYVHAFVRTCMHTYIHTITCMHTDIEVCISGTCAKKIIRPNRSCIVNHNMHPQALMLSKAKEFDPIYVVTLHDILLLSLTYLLQGGKDLLICNFYPYVCT